MLSGRSSRSDYTIQSIVEGEHSTSSTGGFVSLGYNSCHHDCSILGSVIDLLDQRFNLGRCLLHKSVIISSHIALQIVGSGMQKDDVWLQVKGSVCVC